MSVQETAAQLAADPAFAANLTLDLEIPPREARYGPLPGQLDRRLASALAARGITRLYRHQALALEEVAAGRHIAVVTPTASGKTLCYNLPVLDRILRDSEGELRAGSLPASWEAGLAASLEPLWLHLLQISR